MSPSLRRRPARRPLIAALAVVGTALAATAFAGPARAAAPQYKLTLNPVANSAYFSINANGDITGRGVQNGNVADALFRAGSTTPLFLGTPPRLAVDNPIAVAEGLNNADQVVGEADGGDFTALLWPDSATPTDLSQLPALVSTLAQTHATGINNHGLIVGWGRNVHNANVPYTIQNNAVTFLPVLPNGGFDGQPESASDTGTIVGQADTSTTDPVAVEWVNGAITRFPSLPGTFTSEALSVNNSGAAVGAAVLSSDNLAHAVLWAHGTATDLHFGASLGGDAQASAINANGVIVGDGGGHAFIDSNGTVTDLNAFAAGSGVTLTTASGINDQGDIVGTAVNAQGLTVGYELTPLID
jgi:uncharacterized membrane protein